MSFENLIGNDEVKNILSNIVHKNKLTHSYMFIGPTGIGKTLFAKEFAKMILCENESIKPCQSCKSCIQFDSNNNPDLIEILPESNTIKIEQIRSMQEKVLEKPIISERKVYIIKDADCMTKEAGNCLLKTLEEPPSFVTIIMIGSNEDKFLNTIKSRCMKISFKKIPNDKLKKFLEKRYETEIKEELLKACEGSIEKGTRVLDNKEEYEKTLELFSNIEKYSFLDVVNNVEFLYKNKDNIYEILDYINVVLQEKLLKNPKYIKYIEIIEKTKQKLNRNSNYDMSIDNMLYNIWEE